MIPHSGEIYINQEKTLPSRHGSIDNEHKFSIAQKMETRINETTISRESEGMRIDLYLSRRFTYLSRTAWKGEIIRGKISINGRVVTNPHRRVSFGDLLRFDGMGYSEPEVSRDIRILYEDADILGVCKPGNLPVHPAGRYFNNTLLRILEHEHNRPLYPAHRLDRETSGVILFAKNVSVASQIQKNFSQVQKSYIAIVHGKPAEKRFAVNAQIGFDPASAIKKKRIVLPESGETAVTYFMVLFSFGDYTLVRAQPQTGRLHQIRVHLLHAGYPIVGDKMYGRDEGAYLRFIASGETPELLATLQFHRSALHSRSIRFYHPVLKKDCVIKAPVPDDFKEFIETRRYT